MNYTMSQGCTRNTLQIKKKLSSECSGKGRTSTGKNVSGKFFWGRDMKCS